MIKRFKLIQKGTQKQNKLKSIYLLPSLIAILTVSAKSNLAFVCHYVRTGVSEPFM